MVLYFLCNIIVHCIIVFELYFLSKVYIDIYLKVISIYF